MFDYLIARAKEKSTWLGLVSVLGGLGIHTSPELANEIISALLGFFGVLGVLKKEKKFGEEEWQKAVKNLKQS